MTTDVRPQDRAVDEVSSTLEAGLKSCRSVIKNYRLLLNGESSGEAASGGSQPEASTPVDDFA